MISNHHFKAAVQIKKIKLIFTGGALGRNFFFDYGGPWNLLIINFETGQSQAGQKKNSHETAEPRGWRQGKLLFQSFFPFPDIRKKAPGEQKKESGR